MISTLRIFEELSQTMDPAAARKLAGILDSFYAELQQTVTKADLHELKEVVRELAEAQKGTEARVAELAEAQKRTEQRVESLAHGLEVLAQRLDQLTAEVAELAGIAKAHEARLGKLDGRTLELQFRDKASAYLGTVMRRTRLIPVGDLGDDLEGVLTPEEWAELTRADVILQGRADIGGQRHDVYAVVEVSVTLDERDVARVARRAALLRKKGWKTLAVVAGETATPEVILEAAGRGVAVLQDGQQFNWTEALAAA